MKTLIRKVFIRFLFIPLICLIILLIAAIAVLYSQQQRLVLLAVKELNKKLPGELSIGSSNISVFQNFPYVSIAVNDVYFYSGKLKTDKPIFEAEKIFVGFSLTDILKHQYHVKVIFLKNGLLNLERENNGILNIVEASQLSTDIAVSSNGNSNQLDLDLKKIVLKNMNVSYLDRLSCQQVVSHIDNIQSSFSNDSEKIYSELQGALIVDYTRPGDSSLFRHKHLNADLRLSYVKTTQMLKIELCKLKLEDAVFNVSGTADLLHDNTVDLKFLGDKPDFRQLLAFAPEKLAKELKHFKYNGVLDFSGAVTGKLISNHQPRIELSFSCKNAWLHNTETKTKLDSLNFKGYYTNGAEQSLKTSELRLLNFSAKPDKGKFKGNLVLRDFTNPKILMQVNSDLELGFIGAFLGIKDLQRITGHINLKMDFKELVDISLPEQTIGKLTGGIQSELTISNLTFRIPSYPYNIEHLDMHANMKDGFLQLDTLSFRIGNSDFHMNGSLSDLPALFHNQEKPVQLRLNAGSNKIVLKELLSFDSAKSQKAKEEIYGFNVGLTLETSVNELLHPKPLPRGKFKIENLSVAFKKYPHIFHDFGADLTINDTSILLRNLTGQVDSSDLRFSGRLNNYALWFNKIKKGKTLIAFDLKSQRLALKELLGRRGINYIPKEYKEEVFSNVWLRSKMELKYDSVFRFANIKIANISGECTKHPYQLDSIHGNIKFGIDNFIKIDTLQGKIGRSDFNISMRLYTGKDTARRNKENYLQFSSRFLDVNQLTNYVQTAEEEITAPPSDTDTVAVTTVASTYSHADAFNIFSIPFINFNATIDIGRVKYRRLGFKNISTKLRMMANQQIYMDTFGIELAGGKIGARAHFNGSDPNKIYLKTRIRVDNVDLEKLMLKLDYLGQDYVINKNIKGRLTGQVKCYIQIHPDFTLIMDNSEAQIDVNIYDGELVNFTPIQAMSSYFKDKNLNIVRFDTLRNVLLFKNNTLSIPSMNINSSLGYLEISGSQAMDKHMEYYLRIPLKLVTQAGFRKLFGKKQEDVDPDQEDAIEYRDKDKKIHFINLKITGTPDDYKMALGKAK
ncbi:MAG TPA: AsmA-like C-terminal region-containing protein [Puia sp.]|nr:AsmA-like C-terminal region-containing protein [Puia sp.]